MPVHPTIHFLKHYSTFACNVTLSCTTKFCFLHLCVTLNLYIVTCHCPCLFLVTYPCVLSLAYCLFPLANTSEVNLERRLSLHLCLFSPHACYIISSQAHLLSAKTSFRAWFLLAPLAFPEILSCVMNTRNECRRLLCSSVVT